MNENPFSMVYAALVDLAQRHRDFSTIIKPGNLIRFDDNKTAPLKEKVLAADLPELILVSSTGSFNLHETSNTSRVTQQYSWIASTGDQRINEILLPVKWIIFCAMTGWKEVLGRLRWPLSNGRSFVKRADLMSVTDGQSDPQRNRGIIGWSSQWTCEVEMHFSTEDLKGELVLTPNT